MEWVQDAVKNAALSVILSLLSTAASFIEWAIDAIYESYGLFGIVVILSATYVTVRAIRVARKLAIYPLAGLIALTAIGLVMFLNRS